LRLLHQVDIDVVEHQGKNMTETTSDLVSQGKRIRARREFLYSSIFALLGMHLRPRGVSGRPSLNSSLEDTLAELEAQSGGRIGVALLDSASGQIFGHRFDEPFPMCSTFKVLAVAAVLSRIDERREDLQRSVPITQADILKYAPVTAQHVGPSGMTVASLCEAAITLSDNTAANLLLSALGGPGAVTAFARTLGDLNTRLDRMEPALNEAAPGDLRDTTTPRSMAQDLNSILLGSVLTASSRGLLKLWMVQCKTGNNKIRSAAPKDCLVGDKTGSGDHNTSNDIAIIWPRNQPPLLLTVYLTGVKADSTEQQAAIIADVAGTCFRGNRSKS
jgi:beta-lactamase class A